MLDQMLADRKHVVGKGGLVERQRNGRVTRALRMAWNRSPAIDFDGTESEWNQGRKEKVMTKYKIQQGIIDAPAEVGEDAARGGGDTGKSAKSRESSLNLFTTDFNSHGRCEWYRSRQLL